MTEPMKVETPERMMSNFKPTPELDQIFGGGLVGKLLPMGEIEQLVKAGYITKIKDEYGFTDAGVRHARKNLPEQAKVVEARVHKLEEEEREQREKERAKQERLSDQRFAAALIEQGLLVVKDGKYHNTRKGWEGALHWFQHELKTAMEDRDYGLDAEIRSRSGDFEGVPVNQPWRWRGNVMVVRKGFRNIKKQIVNSLSEEERDLFGLPPARLNKPAAEAKARLLEVLTKYRDGAASDLVVRRGRK